LREETVSRRRLGTDSRARGERAVAFISIRKLKSRLEAGFLAPGALPP
jgi:hypothetical protein